jgi:AcrR family transcriptional regulator
MTSPRRTHAPRRPKNWPRKPAGAYHHRDLERALVAAAVRTVREEGVPALTLRSVAARLNVSRTALYRHFPNKAALLATVAREGFRLLHDAQRAALARASEGTADPLLELTAAYVGFAADNRAHYSTMFGGFLQDWSRYPDLVEQAGAAFTLLVETIREEQQRARMTPGDPVAMAELAWAFSHGIASSSAVWPFESRTLGADQLAALACTLLRDGASPVLRPQR